MVNPELTNNRVLIIGLGLMGGSLALALRSKCKMIYGVDIDSRTVEYALQNKIIDVGAKSIDEIEPDYDIVILAIPIIRIIHTLRRFPGFLSPGVLILDLGSTKKEIIEQMNQLPDLYFAVGGHPICGKEQSSIFYSQSDLYKDAIFILVKTARTSSISETIVTNLVKSIGAVPVWMDADSHDEIFAATSHFPYLVSNTLASSIVDPDVFLFGPGFKSTIRLAGSDVDMFLDIVFTNKHNILNKLNQYSTILNQIEVLIETDQVDALRTMLLQGKNNYLSINKKDISG